MKRTSVPSSGISSIAIVAVVLVGGCVAASPATQGPPAPSHPAVVEVTASPPPSAPVSVSPFDSASPTEPSGSGVAVAGSGVIGPAATAIVPAGTPQPTPRPTTPATARPTPTLPPAPFAGTGVVGRALLGPTCPVQRIPPDPACDDKPVPGAVMVVQNAAGVEVARGTTDSQGFFAIQLAPGSYTLVPQPIPMAMHVAPPVPFTVPASGPPVVVDVAYDTGIR